MDRLSKEDKITYKIAYRGQDYLQWTDYLKRTRLPTTDRSPSEDKITQDGQTFLQRTRAHTDDKIKSR